MQVILSENHENPAFTYVHFPMSVDPLCYFPRRIRDRLYGVGGSSEEYVISRDDVTAFMKFVVSRCSHIDMLSENRLCCYYRCNRRYIRRV